MVDIRLCLILDGRLYASLECLECYNLYVTTIRVFKVMLFIALIEKWSQSHFNKTFGDTTYFRHL